jgi:phospholipase/carboxylesterase
MRTENMALFVSALKEKHAPAKVIGLGYSNGANILASMLFRQGRLFDEAVLMHPLIPFEPPVNANLADVRILMTAGRNDPICPAPLTAKLEQYFKARGAGVSLAWHNAGHNVTREEIAAIQAFFRPSAMLARTGG